LVAQGATQRAKTCFMKSNKQERWSLVGQF
jgi:hypothetical protein